MIVCDTNGLIFTCDRSDPLSEPEKREGPASRIVDNLDAEWHRAWRAGSSPDDTGTTKADILFSVYDARMLKRDMFRSYALGTRLGVYGVTAQIGEGAMGQVCRVTDTTLGRQVAIKTLPDAFEDDDGGPQQSPGWSG